MYRSSGKALKEKKMKSRPEAGSAWLSGKATSQGRLGSRFLKGQKVATSQTDGNVGLGGGRGSFCVTGKITLLLEGFSHHEFIWLRTSDPEIDRG